VADDNVTLRQWFAKFAKVTGEMPTHVVFGLQDWLSDEAAEMWSDVAPGALMPMESVPDNLLDQEFNRGYGGNNSPDLCAWSPSWVLFSDNYDGAESLCWVPRHPLPHKPSRPGGG
jgi:hypothetical protein